MSQALGAGERPRVLGPPDPVANLRRIERMFAIGRALALTFGVGRLVAFEAGNVSAGVWRASIVAYLVFAVAVPIAFRASQQVRNAQDATRLSLWSWGLDFALIATIAWLYAPTRPVVAVELMAFIAFEGGVRFELPGAIAGWLGSAAIGGAIVAGRAVALTPDELSFNAGVALILASVMGLVTRTQHLAQHEAERARARAESSRIETQRIERWRSGLVSTLAHDVRSPLATVVSTAELLHVRHRELDDDTREHLIATMLRQCQRVQRLSDDLLDLARLEHGTLELDVRPVPLRALVQRVTAQQGMDGDVEVNVDPRLLAAADEHRMEQVVGNLLTNARKYGAPPVRVAAWRTTTGISLTVQDAGPGVDPAVAAHLFEAFAHGEQDESIGLGLWIVRELVAAQGGRVRYEDAEPSGARFVLDLPASNDADMARPLPG